MRAGKIELNLTIPSDMNWVNSGCQNKGPVLSAIKATL
jgi:hypothetical protein